MGKDKKKQQQQNQQGMTDVAAQARQQYETLNSGPSPMENEMEGISHNYGDLFNKSAYRQMGDYGDIMSGYDSIINGDGGDGGPANVSFRNVSATRPEELGEAYGYLRETAPGYREFAKTGGYSNQDIQELRARSVSPIRTAYGNTMMELNRARSLGGGGGAPNYIAATSKAQRELPGQMADAMTGINAELARDVRQGKLAGLAGLKGVGDSMGGMSSAEAERILRADLANQSADMQAQMFNAQDRRASRGEKLQALSGKTSLYGTTPAMANMFANQMGNAYGLRNSMEGQRQNYGLGLLDAQLRGYGAANNTMLQNQGTPWWKTALQVGGTVAPYVAQYYSQKGGGAK